MTPPIEPNRRVPPSHDIVALGAPTPLWAAVLRDRSELSDARRDVTTALAASGGAPEVAADVSLAMTELAVNALTHGGANAVDISVALTRDGTQVVLVVRHTELAPSGLDASGLTEPPVMAAPEEIRGRGRAIVATLARQFETVRHGSSDVEHTARFDV